MKHIVVILLVLISFLIVPSINAVGVGVKPEELSFSIPHKDTKEAEILVMNAGTEPALYRVYPDSLQNMIEVEPAEFRLEPDGNRLVTVRVLALKRGGHSSTISVVARPLETSGLTTASGVKLPVTINVTGGWWLWLALGLIILYVGLFIIFRKKHEIGEH